MTTEPHTQPSTGAAALRHPVAKGWLVHCFTGLGALCGMFGLMAVGNGHRKAAILWLVVAMVLDGVDGPAARAWHVSDHVPRIDGYTLDLIIDYVTCIVIPVLFMHRFHMLPRNFSLVVGPVHVEFLSDMVRLFVDVDTVSVSPKDFQRAAKAAPATCPWVKVALLCTQYMSPQDKMLDGPSGKRFGQQLARADWIRFGAAKVAHMEAVESFLCRVVELYSASTLPDVPAEVLSRELPAFVVRVGTSLMKEKDRAKFPNSFGQAEATLRRKLQRRQIKGVDSDRAAAPGGRDRQEGRGDWLRSRRPCRGSAPPCRR